MNKAHSAIFFISIWLTGCAGVRLVDNQVSAFAPTPVAPDTSYQFERLPSQQADAPTQDALEAMTERALAKAGLKRQNEGATLLAQVSLSQREERVSIDGPAFGWQVGWHPRHSGGWGLRGGTLFPGLDERRNYWREVQLLLRSRDTQTVVFEARVRHDGPWSDSTAIVPAMLEAALQGFPNPPPGERRVNIEIAR